MTKLKRISSALSIFSLLALSLLSLSTTSASAASLNFPMTLRPATSGEATAIEGTVLPVVLPINNGANINTDFSEVSQQIHTSRMWVAEATPVLPECALSPTIQLVGNHSFTHVANSGPLLNNPTDEPEAGATLLTGNGSLIQPIYANGDMAVGAVASVVSSGSFPTTVTDLSSGVLILMYVETRDDVSQGGVQASFTYSGTPQLLVEYDDSECPQDVINSPTSTSSPTPTAPKTGIRAQLLVIIALLSALLLSSLLYSYRLKTNLKSSSK